MTITGVFRKRLLVLLICMVPAGATAAFIQEAQQQAQQPAPSELLKVSDEMVALTARLRSLQPKTAIQMEVETRDEISQYLNETVRRKFDQGELQSEGRMLQKLGLVPPDMNYVEFTLKLLTEQVGGYYDPDRKKFYIAGWLPPDAQKPILVHELAHALQDQHFNLQAIMEEDRKSKNDDRAMAHMAVMEGDGMAVMMNYILEPSGRSFSQLPDLVFVMRTQFWSMESQYEVFKAAPMFLKELLLFPYGYGAAFLQKVWARDPSWSAVDRIYSDLPASAEQVIHPEKYFAPRDNPKAVTAEDPAPVLGPKWKLVYRNVMGEFSTFLVLKQFLEEEPAKRAAAGWGGDRIMLLENGTHSAVFVATTWDTAEDAEEFYGSLGEWFQRRFPKAQKIADSPAGFSLVHQGEYNAARRDGSDVRFVIGMPESEASRVKEYWSPKQ